MNPLAQPLAQMIELAIGFCISRRGAEAAECRKQIDAAKAALSAANAEPWEAFDEHLTETTVSRASPAEEAAINEALKPVGDAGYPSEAECSARIGYRGGSFDLREITDYIRSAIDLERERVAKLVGRNSTLQETVDAAVEVARRTGKFPGMQLPDNQFGAADWNPERHKQPDTEAKPDGGKVVAWRITAPLCSVSHWRGGDAPADLPDGLTIQRAYSHPPTAQGFGPVVGWQYRWLQRDPPDSWSPWTHCPADLLAGISKHSPEYETRALTVRQPVPADVVEAAEWLADGGHREINKHATIVRDWLRSVSA